MQPIMVSKRKAAKLIGIGKNLFEKIEPLLPYVQPNIQKKYCIKDIERVLENMRRSPCTPHQNKTKKIATSSILLSQYQESGGLEEAVRQTINERPTTTH